MGPARRCLARLGVGARLLGLVLIPSGGLVLVGGQLVAEHRTVAEETAGLARDVEAAAIALEAFVDATHEYRLGELIAYAAGVGLEPHQAGELLDLDLAAELRGVRARLTANPAALAAVRASVGERALDRARAALDEGEFVDSELFGGLALQARASWTEAMSEMATGEAGATLRGSLRRSLQAFTMAADLFRLGNDEMILVATITAPGAGEEVVPVNDLADVMNQFDAEVEALRSVADDHIGPALEAVLEDADFRTIVSRVLDQDGALAVGDLAALFRAGLDRDVSLRHLASVAADDARDHALDLREVADARYRSTVVVLAVVVAVTFVLAWWAARSIRRPLTRLARRAAEVSDGELGGDALPTSGPREAAVLARTLNDAVANLRAVEHQARALAAGDLGTARAASAPGKLGALLGRSVDGLARSITERDELQQRLAYDASHDALTGLLNRRAALDGLRQLLERGRRVAVLFIDLDGFKLVNDEQGHAAGDQVLRVTGSRLRTLARPDIVAARIGGDEFLVAVPVAGEREAVEIAHRFADVLAEPVVVDGYVHRTAASVGVAVSQPGDDADRLLRSADAALYEEKGGEGGGVTLLDGALRAELEERHVIEADLRAAIAAGGLELHYQPIVDVVTRRMHGVEALVRWRKPDGTLVPPDRFIGVAERSGLIVDLDRWVLYRALSQVARWRAVDFPGLRVSVNVSARTLLSVDLVGDVAAALVDIDVAGEALLIEVTETALLHDLDTAAERIAALRALGVRTSIDDFGTGYTSVSQLRRLPVAEVKVDRSFVQALDDQRDRVLVDLVVQMATVLALDVVAEGVETEEQLATLRQLGCRNAQGYLIGRPVPADQLRSPAPPTVLKA